ncbi:MAG: polysaccharide ABC transporter ATP-binding protein [Acidimicrobiia bacterium]
MPPKGTIEVSHLWKRFRADRGRAQFKDKVQRAGSRLRGEGGARGYRWALRDVELAVEPGHSLGLFGANGSGKSTLLKILCGVMYPYAGNSRVVGRIGALIEVSSGMHPELTGRENTYLFGSLLGLPRSMVARRFDEIVGFAEVENAIDRQLKFYSSGMKMRLGFAVAAFLEPEVMLVDEVLAVGDASFQQKCIDRMRAVLGTGTTLVFVSHDLAAIEATCSRGIWLNNGMVQTDGPVSESLAAYRRSIEESAEADHVSTGPLKLLKVEVTGAAGEPIRSQEALEVRIILESDGAHEGLLYLGASEGTASPIFLVTRTLLVEAGESEVRCLIAHLPLPRGRFYLWLGMARKGKGLQYFMWQPVTRFDVEGPMLDKGPRGIVRLAPVHVGVEWETERH